MCLDCYWAEVQLEAILNDNFNHNFDFITPEGLKKAVSEDYIRSGIEWCNETDSEGFDKMPLRCDHVVISRKRMSGANLAVLVFLAMLVVIPM